MNFTTMHLDQKRQFYKALLNDDLEFKLSDLVEIIDLLKGAKNLENVTRDEVTLFCHEKNNTLRTVAHGLVSNTERIALNLKEALEASSHNLAMSCEIIPMVLGNLIGHLATLHQATVELNKLSINEVTV